ncbi:putative hydrolase [Colletotrichum sidae]|uniref:Putative hydrolase n=1 Tax=Colletotrichum sidae TaxID=1347389 RepID=A0A4R8TLR0_9PEZI|nr:putative hydrolase [Colletotrichum sidae]
MEKSSSPASSSGQPVGPRHGHQAPRRRIIAIGIVLALAYFLLPGIISLSPSSSWDGDWWQQSNRPDLETLTRDVFDWLKCARVSVPINWNDTSNPAKVAVALIKVPAKVPVTDPRYGGAIILNPGGPGNSGVAHLLRQGRYIQGIVDAPGPEKTSDVDTDAKYFDIIGFDPRGVNNTTPHLKCFPNQQSELNFGASMPSDWLFGTSDTYVNLAWAHYQAFGQSCATSHGDEPNMAEFTNTAQVVEDVLAIVERHGQWRQAEAHRILDSSSDVKLSALESENVLERTQWKPDEEKLNYWGFSYGTLLGQTFAVMHPGRVSRVIIDGVVDPDDYYSTNWLKNLQDTDQIIFQWARYCNQAPGACPLADPDLPEGVITARIARLAESLLTDPIPVAGNDQHGPLVVYYSDVLQLLGNALYTQGYVEGTFEILKDLLARNGTSLAARKAAGDLSPVALSRDCIRDGPYSEACARAQDQQSAHESIVCGDGADLRNTTKADFWEYFKVLRNQSDTLGATWSGIRMVCSNWQARPAWRVDGPWKANTSHPLLIIGNTYDPVTPLRNAHRVSTLFPKSVVLHQNTEGHCTHSAPSLCTGKAIRRYFQHGLLPEVGTVCEPEYRVWIGCVNPAGCHNRSAEDQALWEALDARRHAGWKTFTHAALFRFILSFGLLSLALSQSEPVKGPPPPPPPPAPARELPWLVAFGRPTDYEAYWSFNTSTIADGPLQPTKWEKDDIIVNVYTGPVNGNDNQNMVHIHVESTSSRREVLWQVYGDGGIVTRYTSLEHEPETSELRSTTEGTFAMIPHRPDKKITLFWRIIRRRS